MRILIIGASGFIGHYLLRRLRHESDYEVTNTYNSRAPEDIDQSWHRLEITDSQRLDQVFLQARPDVVVLLAAIADVGTAERAPERATEVNVDEFTFLSTKKEPSINVDSNPPASTNNQASDQTEDDLPF